MRGAGIASERILMPFQEVVRGTGRASAQDCLLTPNNSKSRSRPYELPNRVAWAKKTGKSNLRLHIAKKREGTLPRSPSPIPIHVPQNMSICLQRGKLNIITITGMIRGVNPLSAPYLNSKYFFDTNHNLG